MTALAIQRSAPAERTIQTTRFGPLAIDENATLTFPDGLPGFEGCCRFVLVPHPTPAGQPDSPFEWLQSLDDGALAFLTIDPHSIVAHYAPRLPQSEMEGLALPSSEAAQLRVLLTIPQGDPCGITANLLAPVVVNPDAQLAKQVVAADDQYSLRHRLLPN